MGQLNDKVALVTGAATGIGLATARRFAAEGATVYLAGRREAALEAAVDEVGRQQGGGEVWGVRTDVSDLADLDRLFATIRERSGRLDVVVANAGVGEYARLGSISEEHYAKTADINIKGTIFTVQSALPLLSEGASVILLSSSAGRAGAAGLSVYGATKAAIRSLARTWAAELAGRGMRVNAITPGPVVTPGADNLRDSIAAAGEPMPEDDPGAAIPLGRIGHPDEVAATALYLASEQSSFTTGAELFVDGGITQI